MDGDCIMKNNYELFNETEEDLEEEIKEINKLLEFACKKKM